VVGGRGGGRFEAMGQSRRDQQARRVSAVTTPLSRPKSRTS
jgi:hypothetical protein